MTDPPQNLGLALRLIYPFLLYANQPYGDIMPNEIRSTAVRGILPHSD